MFKLHLQCHNSWIKLFSSFYMFFASCSLETTLSDMISTILESKMSDASVNLVFYASYRYIPLLGATFTFPQSLGILGGRPGVSTYIVGVQDDKAFYLDPHEVQQVQCNPNYFFL